MSDKLKIMQTRIAGNNDADQIDLHSASIGYPDLKDSPNDGEFHNGFDCAQPVLEESAFRDYVSKTEFVVHAETA